MDKVLAWAKAHKIWATIIVVLVVGAIASPFTSTDNADKKSDSSSHATENPSPTPTVDDSAQRAALVAQAEKIAKDELPKIPFWKGAKFHGTYVSAEKVCVDRTMKDGSGGGFVEVTFPDGKTGEPQDGSCAKPAPKPVDWNSKIESAIKDKLGKSNRDGVDRVASVNYVDGVNVPVIKWAINENLTKGLTKDGAKKDVADMLEVLQGLAKTGMPLKGATFEGTYSLVDQLGNESEDRVVLARYGGATVKGINFDNFIFTNVYKVAASVWLHPAFRD